MNLVDSRTKKCQLKSTCNQFTCENNEILNSKQCLCIMSTKIITHVSMSIFIHDNLECCRSISMKFIVSSRISIVSTIYVVFCWSLFEFIHRKRQRKYVDHCTKMRLNYKTKRKTKTTKQTKKSDIRVV
jgi:hypothetical protein